ncbi:bifunctional diguanylate cyclase/phosphodiesterase [Paenibacillus turpanensis]|uniref:bifunctional diguanylate cyclase/phosphodiesterase n=1 Tax=Paenibacillus turpanensis TaxID=2689078 RepID=UPI00140E20DA|nr:EAL domain-containing protein [Paenibacillus turpanensis]
MDVVGFGGSREEHEGWIDQIVDTALFLVTIAVLTSVHLFNRKTEQKLQESLEMTETLLESSVDGIITFDGSGRILSMNRAAEAMCGMSRIEALGQHFVNVFFAPQLVELHRITPETYSVAGSGAIIGQRLEALVKGNGNGHVLVEMVVTRSGVYTAHLRDITERSRLAEQIRKSIEQYQSVVNQVKEIIFQADAQGRFLFVNPAWEAVTGYPIEDTLGKSIFAYVHPLDEAAVRKSWDSMRRNGTPFMGEARFLHYTDGGRWLEWSSQPVFGEFKELTGITGIMIDVTDRKKQEQELLRRDELLSAVAQCSAYLLEHGENMESFNQALRLLGESAHVDRVLVFEFHDAEERPVYSLRYIWSNHDFLVPDDYSDLHIGADIAKWSEAMQQGLAVKGHANSFSDELSVQLHEAGIHSLLNVPIFVEKQLWGFICFNDCVEERDWTDAEQSILQAAAASFGGAIHRNKTVAKLQEAMHNDFRQTVQNQQQLIFKVSRDEQQQYVCTFFEGRLIEKFGLRREDIYGQRLDRVLSANVYRILDSKLVHSFRNESVTFELNVGQSFLLVSLSPLTYLTGEVHELVGSAMDITERKEAERSVHRLAYYDTLTGLPNRTMFRMLLSQEITLAQEHGERLAVFLLDLDRFKNINDTLGHPIGDRLLVTIAERLDQFVTYTGIVSRLGGDEFLLARRITGQEDASEFANELISLISKPCRIEGFELHTTPSIGISMFPDDGDTTDILMKNADTALYRIKEKGKNGFILYTEEMDASIRRRMAMESSMRKALEKNEFELYYQPRMHTKNRDWHGMEALIRWHSPEMGFVSPAEFIPIAEETGAIFSIGEWVLRTACFQTKAWQEAGYPPAKVSVNLSMRQLEQSNLPELVSAALRDSALDPQWLELEITETLAMNNVEFTIDRLEQLRALGVSLAIDDFGTGHSSLSYLKRLPVNSLKIDRSFVKDLSLNDNDGEIVGGIVALAKNLNLHVVAEGVETEEQYNALMARHCDEVQGYLFGKPMAVDVFEQWVKKRSRIIFET